MSTMKGQKVIKTFEGENATDDFEFPSIGIEDIDRAVFHLFDKKINFQATTKGETSKVPVVFASGERFALTRRKNPIRDKNNALILPIISILRGEIDFSPGQSGKGTPIAFREQENYIIKYRLSEKDRKYQNIINKSALRNQTSVSSPENFLTDDVSPGYQSKPGTIASRRNSLALSFSKSGSVNLKPNINKNIYEIIQVPYPEFVAINYDVIFWTQYMSQANQMMQTLLTNFEGQGEEITMKTPDGYELVAFFKTSFSTSSNFDEFTDSERIIRHNISLTVPGYIINPRISGFPNLARSFFSSPTIDFTFTDSSAQVVNDYQPETFKEKFNRHVLTDITSEAEQELKRGQSSEKFQSTVVNPFNDSKKKSFARIKVSKNRAGETVVTSLLTKKLGRYTE